MRLSDFICCFVFNDNPQHADFNWYKRNLPKLYKQYGSSYVAIKKKKVLGVYDSLVEGINATLKTEEPGSFIVQRCGPDKSAYTSYVSVPFSLGTNCVSSLAVSTSQDSQSGSSVEKADNASSRLVFRKVTKRRVTARMAAFKAAKSSPRMIKVPVAGKRGLDAVM